MQQQIEQELVKVERAKEELLSLLRSISPLLSGDAAEQCRRDAVIKYIERAISDDFIESGWSHGDGLPCNEPLKPKIKPRFRHPDADRITPKEIKQASQEEVRELLAATKELDRKLMDIEKREMQIESFLSNINK